LEWQEGKEKLVRLDQVAEAGDLALADNRDLTANPEDKERSGEVDHLEVQARQVALELPERAAKMVQKETRENLDCQDLQGEWEVSVRWALRVRKEHKAPRVKRELMAIPACLVKQDLREMWEPQAPKDTGEVRENLADPVYVDL